MPDEVAVNAEKRRDLKNQLASLGKQDEAEIVFMHISPGREPVTIYRAKTGEPVEVPAYMVRAVMEKQEDSQPMFVARKEDAPEYKLGTIKCFLHADSPERPILKEIGLAGVTCPAAHLASQHARRQHGLHRHKQEWAAYQEYVEDEKEEKREERLDKQLEATLGLARGAADSHGTDWLDHVEDGAGDQYVKGAASKAAGLRPPCNNCGEAIEGKLADHQCK